jgi:hypothetical protein
VAHVGESSVAPDPTPRAVARSADLAR